MLTLISECTYTAQAQLTIQMPKCLECWHTACLNRLCTNLAHWSQFYNKRNVCPLVWWANDMTNKTVHVVNLNQEAPIQDRDAPGNFVTWLISRWVECLLSIHVSSFFVFINPLVPSVRKPIYVHEISGRFDVGNLKSYVDCDLYFSEKLQDLSSYMVWRRRAQSSCLYSL